MFNYLYECSKHSNKKVRNIYWIFLVIINALVGFIYSIDIASIFSTILGIAIWTVIYLFIIVPRYLNIKNPLFQKGLFWGYMIRTISLVTIGWFYEIYIGLLSIMMVDAIIGTDDFTLPIVLIHGGIATLLTAILGVVIYLLILLPFTNRSSNDSNQKSNV